MLQILNKFKVPIIKTHNIVGIQVPGVYYFTKTMLETKVFSVLLSPYNKQIFPEN